MTKPFDDAIEAVRRLSPEAQDAIATMLRTITDDSEREEEIPAEHLPAVAEGLAQLDHGEFVEGLPAALIQAVFRRASF